MSGCEILCNVRRGKLDENLLPSRLRSISQAMRFVDAICSFAVVDIGKEQLRDDFWGEKESNVNAILERKGKEGIRLNLEMRKRLDLACFS